MANRPCKDRELAPDNIEIMAYIEQVGGIDTNQLGELCIALEDLASSSPKTRWYTHGSEDPIVVEKQSLECFFNEDEILQRTIFKVGLFLGYGSLTISVKDCATAWTKTSIRARRGNVCGPVTYPKLGPKN